MRVRAGVRGRLRARVPPREARDLRLAILLGNVERRLAAWIDGDVRSGHGPGTRPLTFAWRSFGRQATYTYKRHKPKYVASKPWSGRACLSRTCTPAPERHAPQLGGAQVELRVP